MPSALPVIISNSAMGKKKNKDVEGHQAVYFNFDKEANWKLWDGFEAAPGWVEAVERHTVVHSWPLSDWFQPGALTLDRVFGHERSEESERPEEPEPATEPAFRGSDFRPGTYVGYLGAVHVGSDRPGPVPE